MLRVPDSVPQRAIAPTNALEAPTRYDSPAFPSTHTCEYAGFPTTKWHHWPEHPGEVAGVVVVPGMNGCGYAALDRQWQQFAREPELLLLVPSFYRAGG